MALFRTSPHSKAILVAVALGACMSTVWAAPQESQPPELSYETSDLLGSDFRPAYDAKEWDKALGVLEKVLAKVDADSYDAAYALGEKADVNIQKNDMPRALQDLERALAIDDRKHYFKEKEVQEILYRISQISFSEAASTKDNSLKSQLYSRALATMERWLQHADAKSFTQDSIYYIAVVYVTFGQGFDSGTDQRTDRAMLEKSLIWIDKGLRSTAHPRDIFYQMKIAGLYQLNRFKEAADFLEFEVKHKPDTANNWQQLAAIYLQLANAADEKKDTKDSYAYNIRAIYAIERAQKLGFMKTPRDNFNLVNIYANNIDQHSIAADLLAAGLDDETIESTPQNWTTLGGWYQLIHRNDKAIQTFVKAAKLFPTDGEIEYQLAQVYLGISDEKDAFEHIKKCLAKGGTAKPHVGLLFYAYTAMDLQKYDEALKGADEAEAAAKIANASDAVKQAATIKAAVKGNLQDLANRAQQIHR